jgi:Zn-finger nucleic acid-binding protein
MECPVDGGALSRVELEPGAPSLPGFTCGRCSGHWLRFGDYLNWRERQSRDVPEAPPEERTEVAEGAGGRARRCPDCGYLLTRYRVGRGVGFALDRCGNCNGVWLDAGEWAALRGRGLHDNVHQMFGPGWQFAAQTEARQRSVESQFERQLGDDLVRAREFADWVAGHPRRSEILAYVQSRMR